MSESMPVFIGGAGRSGTTLVVDMLGLHPQISPVYETDFVLQLGQIIFRPGFAPTEQIRGEILRIMDQWTLPLPRRPHGKREHEKYFHGPHYVLFTREFAMQQTQVLLDGLLTRKPADAFRDFLVALFADHTQRDGKVRWVNKTPWYVMAWPMLQMLFPQMRFIHCVRDGRDAACSAMTRTWGPKTVAEATAWWAHNVRSGVEFGRRFPSQCLVVRYEDVVRSPEESLARMLGWLGESGDGASILANYRSGDVRLEQSRMGQWRQKFTDDEKRIFREGAGDLLDLLGYEK